MSATRKGDELPTFGEIATWLFSLPLHLAAVVTVVLHAAVTRDAAWLGWLLPAEALALLLCAVFWLTRGSFRSVWREFMRQERSRRRRMEAVELAPELCAQQVELEQLVDELVGCPVQRHLELERLLALHVRLAARLRRIAMVVEREGAAIRGGATATEGDGYRDRLHEAIHSRHAAWSNDLRGQLDHGAERLACIADAIRQVHQREISAPLAPLRRESTEVLEDFDAYLAAWCELDDDAYRGGGAPGGVRCRVAPIAPPDDEPERARASPAVARTGS